MKHDVLRQAEKYTKEHQRKNRWQKVVTGIAAIVVFCTTYALILPAITMDHEVVCGLEEHKHNENCYTQVTAAARTELICSLEQLGIHEHTDDCYDENGEPICGYADFVIHQHDFNCYNADGELICYLPEISEHVHTDSCYADTTADEMLINAAGTLYNEGIGESANTGTSETEISQNTEISEIKMEQEQDTETSEQAEVKSELICQIEEVIYHEHDEKCFDEDGNLICGVVQVLEHSHSEACFRCVEPQTDTEGLICDIPEHTHSDACFQISEDEVTENISETVEYIEEATENIDSNYSIELIDELPSEDEITTTTATVEVTAVNSYTYNSGCGSLIIYNENGTTIENSGVEEKNFEWWYAIVVEKKYGYYWVTEIHDIGEDEIKKDVKAPSEGFILLYHTESLKINVDVKVGNLVTPSSDFWKTTSKYDGTVYGTVTFSEASKNEKDNNSKLDIVEGADTSKLIEVNLYDYGSNINELYKSNTKYPGFQQDNGTVNISDDLQFNFGNNITSDLDAGISGITNNGGSINETAGKNTEYGNANIAIEGAVSPLLTDDYPTLTDGTSLSYLFSNSDYSKKKNTANINGLFQYNSTTGAYTFNSRENHAQFNEKDNTFTLYKQLISSNFMMYPFGNFLPFNDITKLSTQASTIDRSYFDTIAKSAAKKCRDGLGDEYGTLAEQLNKFISLMDSKYETTNWDAYDAANEYFSASRVNVSFSEESPTLSDGKPLMEYIYSIDYDEPTDFFFGMEMKMTLMQPKGGMTGLTGKERMEFYFTGDDDVWIYLDGVLFMDLSGIHRHVGGKIDFVEGKIYYYNLDTTTGDVSNTPYKTVTFEEAFRAAYKEGSAELEAALKGLNEKGTFNDYSVHKLNFYYMERGAGSGVCRMNFNFPLLQKNTIQVEKELAVDSDINILGNPDYPFQIMKADKDGNKTKELFITANTPYTLYASDGSIIQEVKRIYNADGSENLSVVDKDGKKIEKNDWKTTDGNGVFYLKAGQRAEFTSINEDAGKYYVRELLEDTVLEQYGNVTVSGESTTKQKDVIVGKDTFTGVDSPIKDMSDGTTFFRFTNKVDTSKLGKLSVSKQLTEYAATREQKKFDIEVKLDGQKLPVGTGYTVGSESRTVSEEGIITIAADETAEISNILAGTKFMVKETSDSAAGYMVTYTEEGGYTIESKDESVTGVVKTKAKISIKVTNSEIGATVTIPGTKSLRKYDGIERTYTFCLQEVTDYTGDIVKESGKNDTTTATVSKEKDNFSFTINYVQTEKSTLPATYYYRITEQSSNDCLANDTVYIAEVTVSQNENKNGIVADITNMWQGTMVEQTSGGKIPTNLKKYDAKSADFVNTLTGSLTLTKTLVGTNSSDLDFNFIIILEAGNSEMEYFPTSYPATHYYQDGTVKENGIVTFVDGKLNKNIKHGEKLVINDIPYGAVWSITEINADGYKVTTEVISSDATTSNMDDETNGQIIEEDTKTSLDNKTNGTIIVGDITVAYTNAVKYELPETGGAGTNLYTTGGVLLIIMASCFLLYKYIKRGKEDFASS